MTGDQSTVPSVGRESEKLRNIRGKIKNVGAPTFLGGVHSPRFCVSRGNKRHTRLGFVWRGNKGDRKSGPSPALRVSPSAPLGASPSAASKVNERQIWSTGRGGVWLDQGDPPPCSWKDVAGKGVKRGVRKCGNHWT